MAESDADFAHLHCSALTDIPDLVDMSAHDASINTHSRHVARIYIGNMVIMWIVGSTRT